MKRTEKKNKYMKEYNIKNKEKIREYAKLYQREYRKRSYVKEREKKYRQSPRGQEKIQESNKRHAKKHNIYNKKRAFKHRLICIKYYTNEKNCCSICGENDVDVLTIDHINGGGNQHRKTTGHNMPFFLIKNNFPKGYRILCMNCNMKEAKKNGLYGTKQFVMK